MAKRRKPAPRELLDRISRLELQMLQVRRKTASELVAIQSLVKADTADTRLFMRVLYEGVLTRLHALGEAMNSAASQPERPRSREEMEEIYKQIVTTDPHEGPRLIEVHKTVIGMLDRMIEQQAKRWRQPA